MIIIVIFAGRDDWRVDLVLHSMLPIPWKVAPVSDIVTIQLSNDPRNALSISIGGDKEIQTLRNNSETLITPSHSKTSIAVMPIRVTSSIKQVNNILAILSPEFS